MKNRKYFLVIFLLIITDACSSQKRSLSPGEQNSVNLFNDFKNYLVNSINKNEDIGDASHIKYILLHYVFVNKKPRSSNLAIPNEKDLTTSQAQTLKKEVTTFYNYLKEHQKDKLAENVTLMPIRISNDTLVYNGLTGFQKKNTFIFFDKRFPGRTLGYVLFMPVIKDISTNSRIWSWTLLFKFGRYMFKSVTGEEGYEYMFDPANFKEKPAIDPSF
ncbi:hypothetical protein FW778_14255 [Ginsengibacter hankyongi]|uniref:Uncharacterized protein n=1 Tax=Ginsengibacter hankyongi TaxID=2607284 RepID=A0A5J5IJY7_9BACT|nr:hypothetical protein [Ginsengibacter hankyongi]KAA9038705.1 hypothetical protein FW778_14255 [Ginsengibacter hankyongi]